MWQILCDKLLSFYRSWRTDFSLPVLRQTVLIDTFFAFRSFLVEEQNFQLPLCVRSLLTWRARVKRNPLVTVKIRVAGLSWARNHSLGFNARSLRSSLFRFLLAGESESQGKSRERMGARVKRGTGSGGGQSFPFPLSGRKWEPGEVARTQGGESKKRNGGRDWYSLQHMSGRATEPLLSSVA